MDNEKARIENDCLYGMEISQYFSVQLNNGENPSICPEISLDGMPVEIAVRLIFDALKVRGRTGMRRLSTEELKKAYKGKISWNALMNKEGTIQQTRVANMSDEQLDAYIETLNANRKPNS